jgi:curved DNA-binding protein CbpA
MARSFYDVLLVSPHADRELITVVYRHLAKRYHPDRDPSPEAASRMAELNEAYATLSDPERRTHYDARMGAPPRPEVVRRKGDGRPMRAGAAIPVPPDSPYGEAGPPPTNPPPKGRALAFGRYRGWTLNQVARYDRDYVEWLSRTTMGRNYKHELDELLRRAP